jgi:hypothetical protein
MTDPVVNTKQEIAKIGCVSIQCWKRRKSRNKESKRLNWRRSLDQEVQNLQVTPLFVVDEERLDIKTVALRFLLSGRGFSDFSRISRRKS